MAVQGKVRITRTQLPYLKHTDTESILRIIRYHNYKHWYRVNTYNTPIESQLWLMETRPIYGSQSKRNIIFSKLNFPFSRICLSTTKVFSKSHNLYCSFYILKGLFALCSIFPGHLSDDFIKFQAISKSGKHFSCSRLIYQNTPVTDTVISYKQISLTDLNWCIWLAPTG